MKTYNQIEQRSDEWHWKKKGVISGTRLGQICGTPKARQQCIYEVIAERLQVGIDDSGEHPMSRGIRLEDEAVAQFEFQTGLTVTKTGFCENDDEQFIGYSPDGLIGETQDVEIKCPMGKAHVEIWLTNKVPKQYWYQIVQAFCVNDKLEKRYFVSYNPDIPTHPLTIIEINRVDIEADIKRATEAQVVFLAEIENILKDIIKF